jgi:hypothetical protein
MAIVEKDFYLKIGRPHNACEACGAEISHAGKHPSVLRRGTPTAENAGDLVPDSDAPRREDYCAECWQKLAERDFMGFWVTKRQPPKQRKIESKKERNAGLLAWFEHLQSQQQDPEIRQSLYFLAHLLMKYGVFKWQRTDTMPDGDELIYFKQSGSDDEIAVAAADITDERSVEIKRELDAFLLQFANAQPTEETTAPGPDAAGENDSDG